MKSASMKQLQNKLVTLEHEIAQQKCQIGYYYNSLSYHLTSPKSFITAALGGFTLGLLLPLRKAQHMLKKHTRTAVASHPLLQQFSQIMSFVSMLSPLLKHFKKQRVANTQVEIHK